MRGSTAKGQMSSWMMPGESEYELSWKQEGMTDEVSGRWEWQRIPPEPNPFYIPQIRCAAIGSLLPTGRQSSLVQTMYVVQNKQTAVQHSAAVAYESYSLFWTRTNEIGFNLQVKQWRNEHSQVAASRKVRACPITWWRQHGQPPDRRRRCGYFISYL